MNSIRMLGLLVAFAVPLMADAAVVICKDTNHATHVLSAEDLEKKGGCDCDLSQSLREYGIPARGEPGGEAFGSPVATTLCTTKDGQKKKLDAPLPCGCPPGA